MSADRYSICPRCYKEHEENKVKRTKELNDSYGKVSADAFLYKKEEVDRENAKEPRESLREDYYFGFIGSEERLFEINYDASCSQCNFEFSFKMTSAQVLSFLANTKKRS